MDYLVRKIYEIAGDTPLKEAVIFKDETLCYRDLCFKMEAVASFLRDKGIKKGDRVCFSTPSKPQMVYTYLGIVLVGAVAVFLDKNATADSVNHIYNTTEAKILLWDKPLEKYEQNIVRYPMKGTYEPYEKTEISMIYEIPDKDEISEMLFTTGTTSAPKGVVHTYESVYAILQNTILGVSVSQEERVLLPLPLNHSFALRVLRAVLYQGATLILQNGFTFAKNAEDNILNHHCTAMACVPASYEVMKSQMKEKFSQVMSKLSYIEFGAGSLNVKQRKEITSLLPGVRIYNTWGSSETGGVIFGDVSQMVKDENLIGALGKVISKAKVRVVNGRMALAGSMLMKEYFKNTDLTKETLFTEDNIRWLLTGDCVSVTDEGYVFMKGRADDILNVGGEKVSPIEVSEMASLYQGIKECVCVGEEDEILGQHPILAAVIDSSFDEGNLMRFLSQKLERYKLPARVVILDELPKNAMSKIDKNRLMALLQSKDEVMDTGCNGKREFLDVIFNRRSIRNFLDKEIPKESMDLILKAALQAPSGRNMQTWQFFVLQKQEDILNLKEAIKTAVEKAHVKMYGFENPKALILVTNDIRNKTGCQDASCATENMLLAASALGLGGCWLNPLLSLREVSPVKELLDEFGVPKNHVVYSAVALGYPADEGKKIQRKDSVIHFV